MNTRSTNCIVLFVKSPVAGKVKTRLAAEIGADAAVGLYKCFVEDLLSMIENLDGGLKLVFHPPEARSRLQQWLGKQQTYNPQKGNDLGEKMKNAFADVFEEGFSKVVAIGSDSPDLPEEFLRQAFAQLDSFDAVIGPSSDGGYYLIGFSKDSFVAEAFDDIAWSTPAVCDQTRAKLESHGLTVHLLPQWHDVDRRSDLDGLVTRNKNTPFRESKTFGLIRRFESKMSES
ncbi:MAG: TIGR04282 family arsenosugar biosynthesis glycosyltransferase [Phycisphaerales bacterium]|nr:MAG: TIGR04282 family arsenosugar biosynthesis glycosyltransferase [Phycisphaerales bacterium]